MGRHIISTEDKAFLQPIRNLVINVLLTLEFLPSLLTMVTESQIKRQNKEFQRLYRTSFNVRYPRWLGKKSQPLSVVSAEKITNFSP